MRTVLIITLAVFTANSAGRAQQAEVQPSRVDALLSKLHSKDWPERGDAVDEIRSDPAALHSRKIRQALIDLLEEEYRQNDEATGKTPAPNEEEGGVGGEGYGEYCAWLADTVSSFADWNDPRQACIMVNAATVRYPQSPAQASTRARAAMPCILKMAKSENAIYRAIAVPMLVEALARGRDTLDPVAVQRARQIILNGLRDSDAGIRGSTVSALRDFGETDTIPALQEVARSDAASEKADNGSQWFPIRELAAKAIEAIQSRTGQH